MMMRVVGCRVSGDLGVHPWRATGTRGGRVFHDERRAALGGHVTARGPVERLVGVRRLTAGGQPPARDLAGERVGGEARLGTAGENGGGAAADGPPSLREAVKTAGGFGDHYSRWPLETVPDRGLAGGRRIEPGDGLVHAHGLATTAPQPLDLPLAEVVATGTGREHHRGRVGIMCRRVVGGVGEREFGGGHAQPRPPVGLQDNPSTQVVGGVEPLDLAGEPRGVPARVETADRPHPELATQCRTPVFLGPDAARGDHANTGDNGTKRRPSGVHRASWPRSSTMAD